MIDKEKWDKAFNELPDEAPEKNGTKHSMNCRMRRLLPNRNVNITL